MILQNYPFAFSYWLVIVLIDRSMNEIILPFYLQIKVQEKKYMSEDVLTCRSLISNFR